MKNLTLSSILVTVLAFVFMSFSAGERASYSVDVKSSKIGWTGYKVTGQHAGLVNLVRGTLAFDGDMLSGGNFEIDMNSISCTDLEGEWADKLVGHLKSDDFFGAANYPTAKFNITNVASRGKAGEYKITGDLTIKNTTKPVKFNANMVKNATNDMVATAILKIDRSEFDIRYGSGSFFDSLGDKTIYDEFDINLNLVIKGK